MNKKSTSSTSARNDHSKQKALNNQIFPQPSLYNSRLDDVETVERLEAKSSGTSIVTSSKIAITESKPLIKNTEIDDSANQIPSSGGDFCTFNPNQGRSNLLLTDMDNTAHLKNLNKIANHLKANIHKNLKVDPNRSMTKREEHGHNHKHECCEHDAKREDQYTKTANFNKKLYMNDFAVEYEIPTAFVLNSRVFTNQPDYYFQVIKYVTPMHGHHEQRIILRLMKIVNGGNCFHQTIDKVDILGKSNKHQYQKLVTSCFSQDGGMFGFIVSDLTTYKLFVVKTEDSDPHGLIQSVRNREELGVAQTKSFFTQEFPKKNHINDKEFEFSEGYVLEDTDIEQVSYSQPKSKDQSIIQGQDGNQISLRFDTNNRALIGQFENKFFIFKYLKEGKNRIKFGEVQKSEYSNILNVTYTSGDALNKMFYPTKGKTFSTEENKSAKLYIAAKRKTSFQVDILELELDNAAKSKDTLLVLNEHDAILKMPYQVQNYMDPMPIVHINHNCSMVLFVSTIERFVVERIGKTGKGEIHEFNRYKIPIVKTKYVIHYVEEDYDFGGFYIVCSLTNDWQLRVIHTHKHGFKIRHSYTVEHGKLWIYDLNVILPEKHIKQTNLNESNFSADCQSIVKTQNRLFVLGRNQQNFIVCHTQFRETRFQNFDTKVLPSHYPWRKMNEDSNAQKNTVDSENPYKFDLIVSQNEYEGSDYKAYSFCWPILVFADSDGQLHIINGFNRNQKIVKQILKGEDAIENTICQTYVTPQYNLYVLVSNGSEYKVYSVNIEQEKLLSHKRSETVIKSKNDCTEILRYENNELPSKMFIRDKTELKDGCLDKLFIFVLHGHTLYQWRMDQSELKVSRKSDSIFPDIVSAVGQNQQPSSITQVSNVFDIKLHEGKDNNLFYIVDHHQTENTLEDLNDDPLGFENTSTFQYKPPRRKPTQLSHIDHEFVIEELHVGHMKTLSKSAYVEQNNYDQMVTFDYDRQAEKFIMLFRQKDKDDDRESAAFRGNFKIKIFDIRQQKIQIELRIKNLLLIKLFASGFFCVTDGHIYHSNSVVKIRYDLLEQFIDHQNVNVTNLTEEALFDIYEGVMDTPEGYTINSSNILFSHYNDRICWLIEDYEKMSRPTIIRMTPYLHDRRIYLDIPRKLKDKNVFVTSQEVEKKHIKAIDKSQSITQEIKTITHIIRLDFTDNEMKVFNHNGLCIKQINFANRTKGLGGPVAASNDGSFLVFTHLKKSDSFEDTLDSALCFTIMEVTHTELKPHYVLNFRDKMMQRYGKDYKKEVLELYNQVKLLIDKGKFQTQVFVNDDADVLIRFNIDDDQSNDQLFRTIPNLRSEFEEMTYDLDAGEHERELFVEDTKCDRMIFIHCKQDFEEINEDEIDESKEKKLKIKQDESLKQSKFISVQRYFSDFKMEFNEYYIIMWGNNEIFQLELQKAIDDNPNNQEQNGLTKINLQLDKKDSFRDLPKITRVYPSPARNKMCIVIQTDLDEHTILNWECIRGYEINHHVVKGPFFITFDSHDMYADKSDTLIIRKDYTTISELFVNLTCFKPDVTEIEQIFQEEHLLEMRGNGSMNSSKGLRFDGKNHNWILFENYLILPFSYMSFMIKDQIEHSVDSLNDNSFDPSPFNYIFNKSSSFMDSRITRKDTELLEHVLDSMEKHNPYHLSLLNYAASNPNFNHDLEESENAYVDSFRRRSALSVALTNKNATGVSCLLKYMSKVKKDTSARFHELFRFLVGYDEFIQLLKSLPQQPKNMKNHTTYKVFKKSYMDKFYLPAIWHNIKQMFMKADFTSPVFSHIGDFILQSKTTNTVLHDRHYFKHELQKRYDGDKNLETPVAFHDYPVRIQSVKCGWMFQGDDGLNDQKEVMIFENTHLDFLANIYKNDDNEYYHLPYIQIIIDNLYEKLLQREKSFGNMVYQIVDTFLILVQFVILYAQITQIDMVKLKENVPTADGVNLKGTVTFNNAGNNRYLALYIGIFQILMTFSNVVAMIVGKYGTAWILYLSNLTFAFTDVGVKTLVLYLVFERFEASQYRYSKTNIKNKTTGVTKPVLDYNLTEYDIYSCYKSSNCDLHLDITFEKYQQIMTMFILSVWINLFMLVFKILNRTRLFILKMAEFIDLLNNVLSKLLPFLIFTIMFIFFCGGIFSVLGQYQLLIDIWYVYDSEIKGQIPKGYVTDKDARADMIGNKLQDEQESVQYDTFQKSVLYVYRMMLGEAEVETFNAFKRSSDSPATVLLYFTWVFVTFLVMIILLNIIIAIMGQVQDERTARGLSIKYKHKLSFIIDRWDTIQGKPEGAISRFLIETLCCCCVSEFVKEEAWEEYIIGVTSLHAEQEEKSEIFDTQMFTEKAQELHEKILLSDITLNEIKNECFKIKRQSRMNYATNRVGGIPDLIIK